MSTQHMMFCQNPWVWCDVVIDWKHHSYLQFAMCSPCWADSQSTLGGGPIPLESLPYVDFNNFWNEPRIQEIRKTWLDGKVPSMCKGCPRLRAGSDPPIPVEQITDPFLLNILANRQTATTGPRVVNLSYDPSCGLACPSCRTHKIQLGLGDIKYAYLRLFQDRTIRPILRGAEWAFFSGYGDPFGSLLYMDLLRTLTPEECPDLKLSFLTNGIGFTEKTYHAIPLRDRIKVVQFSMDAATPETYAKLRGGDWDRLMENCRFVTSLRQAGKIDRSEWGFVFQSANWRELPAFLDMAKDYAVDKVMVYTILNHTHDAKYGERAIHHPDHPDHAEAMRVLDAARTYPGLDVYVELAKDSSTTA